MLASSGYESDSSSDSSADLIIDWLNEGDRDTMDFNDSDSCGVSRATMGIDSIDGALDGGDNSKSFTPSASGGTSTAIMDLSSQSDYIQSHSNIFLALMEVQDLHFSALSTPEKVNLMKSMDVQLYQPGDMILDFGESTQDFYIVIASDESKSRAHVEILSKDNNVVTHLYRGEIFGHMFFWTRQPRNRNASVWIPVKGKSCPVWIGRVDVENFSQWSSYRESLIMKSIPFIANMPLQDKLNVVRLATFRYFTYMEIILSQGDMGDEFFIILDGVAKVMEYRRKHTTAHVPNNREVATLRAGHYFGEMALISNKPRNASVICTSDLMTCLSWNKDTFHDSFSDEFRTSVMSMLDKRIKTRTARIARDSNKPSHKRSDSKSTSRSTTSSNNSPLTTPFAESKHNSEMNLSMEEDYNKENEPLQSSLGQESQKVTAGGESSRGVVVSDLRFTKEDLNSINKNTGFESFASPDASQHKDCDNLMVKEVTSVISSRLTSGSCTPARQASGPSSGSTTPAHSNLSPKGVKIGKCSSGDGTLVAGSTFFDSDTKGHLTMTHPNMNLDDVPGRARIERSKSESMEDTDNVEYVRQQINKINKMQADRNKTPPQVSEEDYVYGTPPRKGHPLSLPPVTMTKELVFKKSTTGAKILNDKYVVIKEVGKGSFGSVLKVQTQTGEFYAMKTISRALLDIARDSTFPNSPSRIVRDKSGYLKLSPKQNDPFSDYSNTSAHVSLDDMSPHDMAFGGVLGDGCKDYLGNNKDNSDDSGSSNDATIGYGMSDGTSDSSGNKDEFVPASSAKTLYLGSLSVPSDEISSNYSDKGITMEVKIMKRLRHENIVSLHEVIDDPLSKKIYLIQEFMEGPLMEHSVINEPLPTGLIWKYFREILRGLQYLFRNGIVHRDIKPQNILISRDGVAKIADFGAAVWTGGHEKSKYAGTPAFTAPELNLPKEFREKDFSRMPCIDIFALGATLYNMAVGHPPWMSNNELDLAAKIQNLEPLFPVDIDPNLKFLVLRMLDKDYRTRYTIDDILRDEWVTNENEYPLLTSSEPESDTESTSESQYSHSPRDDSIIASRSCEDGRFGKDKGVTSQKEEEEREVCAQDQDSDDDSYGDVVAGSEGIMAVLDQLNSSESTPCSELEDFGLDASVTMPLPMLLSPHLDCTSENLNLGIRVGVAASIGTRGVMEDYYLADCNADSDEGDKKAIFGVFDGHNGNAAAAYIRSYLQSHHTATGTSAARDTKDVLRESFAEIDIDLLSESLKKYMEKKYCDPQNALRPANSTYDAGSTAVVAVLRESEDCTSMVLTVANCGDSRCVLRRKDGTVVQCSNDHRPTTDSERPRIEASGILVAHGRINGVMSLSRSIGDFNYKFTSIKDSPLLRDLSTDVNLSMEDIAMMVSQWKAHMLTDVQNGEFWSRNFLNQPIKSEPEMYEMLIPVPCEEIEFMLLASDGLFDHIGNEDAVKSVRRQLLQHRSVERAARHLIKKVQKDPMADDNITIVIVVFGQK